MEDLTFPNLEGLFQEYQDLKYAYELLDDLWADTDGLTVPPSVDLCADIAAFLECKEESEEEEENDED